MQSERRVRDPNVLVSVAGHRLDVDEAAAAELGGRPLALAVGYGSEIAVFEIRL